MLANVCGIDKTLRILVGALLIAWVLFLGGPTWAWIGLIPLLMGIFGSCILYKLVGINTCKKSS